MNYNLSVALWLIASVVGFSALVSLYFIWTSINLGSALAKFFVTTLRLSSLAVLGLLLLNPVRLEKVDLVALPKSKTFLIDHSKSMQMGTDKTRLEEVHTVLDKNKAFEASRFYFSEKLSPNTESLGSTSHSYLGKALYSALQKEEKGQTLSELFLFTDGRLHDRQKLSEAIQFALDKGIKVHTFLPQEKAVISNIALVQCEYPRSVSPQQQMTVKVKTKTEGFVNEKAIIKLMGAQDKKLKASKTVKLNEGEQEFEFKVKAGNRPEEYLVKIEKLAKEITAVDNSYKFRVDIDSNDIKVLYMEGSNSQHPMAGQSRRVHAPVFMEQAWRETGNIKFDTLLVSKQMAVGGTLFRKNDASLSYPTTKEELFTYDVVICSDINRFILSKEQLAWTRELIEKRGGGFCMIGGDTSFGDGGWDKTTWEQMIPIDMSDFGYGNREIDFDLVFNPKYITHPILKVHDDPQENAKILKRSFRLTGCNLIDRLKPGAINLASHEYYEDMSVLAIQNYGKGRSMVFTSDSAGGWGEAFQGYWGPNKRNNKYYKRFWVNAVNWLAQNSLNRQKTDLQIRTESIRYEPGERVKMWVSINSLDLDKKAKLKFLATFGGGKSDEVQLKFDKKTGFYVGSLDAPESGGLKPLIVSAYDSSSSKVASSFVNLDIRKVDLEFKDLTIDHKFLGDLSKLTGGESFRNFAEFEELFLASDESSEERNHQVKIPMWDQWWVLALILFLLAAEWLFRKIHLGALS